MKDLQFYFAVISCLCLFSCQSHDSKNKAILHAEAIINVYPDSAYKLLSSIPHPENLSNADYAAWCLQYTQAQYKLYKDIKSDSIIRNAVNYYSKGNLSTYSGTAWYLLGCISQLQGDNKKAMEAYKQSEELLKNTTENNLKGLVDFKIGTIYTNDELFSQSLFHYKRSFIYFKKSGNTNYQVYAYRAISDMYNQLDYPFDSVMHYLDTSLKLSRETHDSASYYSILSRQGELLYNKDFPRSKEYILKGYNYFPSKRPYYAAYLSYIYSNLNNLDSAKYYLNISLADTLDDNTKTLKLLTGAYVAKNEGNHSKAFDYLQKAYTNRVSGFQKSIREQLFRIDKQYDLTKKEEENAALKINNQYKVIVIGVLVIAVLVLLVLFLIVSSRYRKKQAEHRIETQRMEFALKAKQAENDQKRDLLLSKLQSRIANTLQLNRLTMGLMKHEKLDDFIKELSTQAILSEPDWQYYIQEVDHIYDGKLSALPVTHPQLTRPDMIVITLLSLGLDISDCCNLLDMKKNAMYHRRNIIKDRLGIPLDVDLEDWLSVYLTP
ncbi:MAG: hypothetical protein PHT07_06440 [Paludibacter sp.]|nr:hypothetical protein [Paludibacter sp.]